MYQTLDVFQTASAMARHAGRRQTLVAQNIANADTPGYQARHIAAFSETYAKDPAQTMRATRPGHMGTGPPGTTARPEPGTDEPAPNGNAVTLEQEMLNAVEVAREHRRAVTVYRSAMDIIRMSIGRN